MARTGRLISKEFVDESQPGLAIVLDNQSLQNEQLARLYEASKHNPFETAVKIAASLGDYALKRGYPLHLTGEFAPHGPLTADLLWQTLARVSPNGERPLAESLSQITQTFVAVILPYPNEAAVSQLIPLAQRGHTIRAYLVDVSTFPQHDASPSPSQSQSQSQSPSPSSEVLADMLKANQIETCLISYDTDWTIDEPLARSTV